MATYCETFDDGPGGWYGFISNHEGMKQLEWQTGTVTSRSPWWIDYNHAPPGAGYMHMLFCLYTRGPLGEAVRDIGGANHFIGGEFSTDFTGAKVSLRQRGELIAQAAQFALLIQGNVDGICSGWVRTGEVFHVTEDWSEQTITLDPDPAGWTALGSRHDRTDSYGVKPLEKVLGNVDVNIMLILFPLEVVPMGPLDGDPHLLRPGRDYPVWRHKLPEGYVTLNEVRIDFR